MGRESGQSAIDEYFQTKYVWINLAKGVQVRSSFGNDHVASAQRAAPKMTLASRGPRHADDCWRAASGYP
ncbi:MAG TPA: hypothetical protein VEH50_10140, partial [Methylomirabilota bacterium]|nr:hypothetical protein [Methylomirabilota bacterium]